MLVAQIMYGMDTQMSEVRLAAAAPPPQPFCVLDSSSSQSHVRVLLVCAVERSLHHGEGNMLLARSLRCLLRGRRSRELLPADHWAGELVCSGRLML